MTERTMKNKNKPGKKFGQHFLIDSAIADRIVDFAELTPDDTVLEIGPGKGILTGRLLERTGHVTAVEIDRNLSAALKSKFGGVDGFRLVEADILGTNLGELFRDVSRRIKVVSNLPYYISTPVIELLCRNRHLISNAVLMLQREVASRLVAEPGSKEFGLTTLNLALSATGQVAMHIEPEAFSPPPAVMSSVILLEFGEEMLYPLECEEIFRNITGAAFRQRRKMLRNTLVPYLVSLGVSENDVVKMLGAAGIDPMARPETLSPADFVNLSNAVTRALG